jgi:hypothetical protein
MSVNPYVNTNPNPRNPNQPLQYAAKITPSQPNGSPSLTQSQGGTLPPTSSTPVVYNPVPPEFGSQQEVKMPGNWQQTGTIVKTQTVPVYTRSVSSPLQPPVQTGSQTIYTVEPLQNKTALKQAKQQESENTYAQTHPQIGGTMNPTRNQLVLTGKTQKDPLGIIDIPVTTNPTQNKIFSQLSAQDQLALTQYQNAKTTSAMTNLGLFLGASAIAPVLPALSIALPAISLLGVTIPSVVTSAAGASLAGIGISQAFKTGSYVLEGKNWKNSLLTPQEALTGAETGIIFAGATGGALRGVSMLGQTGARIAGFTIDPLTGDTIAVAPKSALQAFGASAGRFGVNVGVGAGVGTGLEAVETGKVTSGGVLQNLAFSAAFAGLGETFGAVRTKLPTWIGGGVKGTALEPTREAMFTTAVDKPLPNDSNIKIEGADYNVERPVKQMSTTRVTEVNVKNIRVPYKDAILARQYLDNAKSIVADFAGTEKVTTFTPPTKAYAKFNTATLKNDYPSAGEVTTFGRVGDLGADIKLVPDIQKTQPRNNLLDMTDKISSGKISSMENSFLPETEFTNTNGVVAREFSFAEEPKSAFSQKLTGQQIDSGRQNLSPEMEMPYTKNVTTEVSSKLMTGDIGSIRSAVMKFNLGEQFSETRVGEPYIAAAKGDEILAVKAQGNTPAEASRVSLRTVEANFDDAVTEFRFKSGMEVPGQEVSEFDIKLPKSNKKATPAVLLTELKGAPQGASEQSTLALRDITNFKLKAEVPIIQDIGYAKNLPEGLRQDIFKRAGIGEMEGAPKSVSDTFMGKTVAEKTKVNITPKENNPLGNNPVKSVTEILDNLPSASKSQKTNPFSNANIEQMQDNFLASPKENFIERQFNNLQTKIKSDPLFNVDLNAKSGSMKPMQGFTVTDEKGNITIEGASKGANITNDSSGFSNKIADNFEASQTKIRGMSAKDFEALYQKSKGGLLETHFTNDVGNIQNDNGGIPRGKAGSEESEVLAKLNAKEKINSPLDPYPIGDYSTLNIAREFSKNVLGEKTVGDYKYRTPKPFDLKEYSRVTQNNKSGGKPIEGYPLTNEKTGEIIGYEGYSKGSQTEKLVSEMGKQGKSKNTRLVDVPYNLVSVDLAGSSSPLNLSSLTPVSKQKQTQQNIQVEQSMQVENPFTASRSRYRQQSREAEEMDYLYNVVPDAGISHPQRAGSQQSFGMGFAGLGDIVGARGASDFGLGKIPSLSSFTGLFSGQMKSMRTPQDGSLFNPQRTGNNAILDVYPITNIGNEQVPITTPIISPILDQTPILKPQPIIDQLPQQPQPFDNPNNKQALSLNLGTFKLNEPGWSFGSRRRTGLESRKKTAPILTGKEVLKL